MFCRKFANVRYVSVPFVLLSKKVVCLNAIVLCAKLECVAADDMRDDILILVRILYASLRQNRIGSKVSGAVTKFDFWLSGVVDERSENRRAPAVG